MTELESDPRFVSSTNEGLQYAVIQFVVLSLLFPLFWDPILSFWVHYASQGCGLELPSKFISKIIAMLGALLFIFARVGYLSRAYGADGRFPCNVRLGEQWTCESELAAKHLVNVIFACLAGWIVICTSFLRLLAPWLADEAELDRAARVDGWDYSEKMGIGTASYGIPFIVTAKSAAVRFFFSCRLCAKEIEPDGSAMSAVSFSNWFARLFVLIGLALDVSSREGRMATALGVVGLFLCCCVGISFLWYTFVRRRGKYLVPHQDVPAPITSPEAEQAADVWKREHRGTFVLVWVTGCALLFPVHLLRAGESY